MTNREWLNSLSDEEFSKYLDCGELEEYMDCPEEYEEYTADICRKCRRNWLQQEHKKIVHLTDAEKYILENLDKKYKWIARDDNGGLNIYAEKPYKIDEEWQNKGEWTWLDIYKHLFQFIEWNDEEPYNIEELLKEE